MIAFTFSANPLFLVVAVAIKCLNSQATLRM